MNITIDRSILNCADDDLNCTRCRLRYTGEYCEYDLQNSFWHFFLVILNQVLSQGASLFFLVWIAYGLYIKLGVQKRKVLSVGMLAIYALAVSLVFRIIVHVDMFNFYFLVEVNFTLIISAIYLVFLLSGTFLGVSVWFTIVSGMKKLKTQYNFTFPKVLSVVMAIVLIASQSVALVIVAATGQLTVNTYLVNILLGLCSITMIIMLGYYLPMFHRVISTSKVQGGNTKLIRMRSYLIAYMGLAIFSLLSTVIPYVTYRPFFTPNDYQFLIFYAGWQLTTRISEGLIYVITILLVLDWFPYMEREPTESSKSTKGRTQNISRSDS